jgi:deoxyribodipyrimidine photo-lyase
MKQAVHIFWFRRDLRVEDNIGLYQALQGKLPVLPLFIFDTTILNQLQDKQDKRVHFIHDTITALQAHLVAQGKTLFVVYGNPTDIFEKLTKEWDVKGVLANRDYEPRAIERDEKIKEQLAAKGIPFVDFKDQVIFEKDEVTKDDGKPYTIYTPYANKWRAYWEMNTPKMVSSEKQLNQLLSAPAQEIPSLQSMGFAPTDLMIPAKKWNTTTVSNYTDQRNFPSIAGGTTHLSVHLRFGTISIRQLALETKNVNSTFFNELIWRDFYHMILWHFPQVGKGKSFKPQYDFIEWRNNEQEFEAWCAGKTGYPIVDAGMRELNTTGFMHNRVRMIVASFLTKHLLIDWRWGEAYFAQKLLDFDLAANNGGWQWASGSGCDAAPYFRVFNPRLQTEKFDKDLKYIRYWVPELDSFEYPQPIVVHEVARERVLAAYAKALKDK